MESIPGYDNWKLASPEECRGEPEPVPCESCGRDTWEDEISREGLCPSCAADAAPVTCPRCHLTASAGVVKDCGGVCFECFMVPEVA